MDTLAELGSAAGLGFLAGIRLYFTVFALGFAIRLGWFHPGAGMEHLALLSRTPILVASGLLLVCEFAADKVPWFDSIWDAVHTFIRPIGAAALGVTAFGTLDPSATVIAGLVSGTAALAGHGSKAATRVTINHSPEPFSNWIVSFVEDMMVPVGLWFVLHHPVASAVVVGCFTIVIIILARAVVRRMRTLFQRLSRIGAA